MTMLTVLLTFAVWQPAGGPCTGLEAVLRASGESLDRGEWKEAERRLEPLSTNADCGGVVLGLARVRSMRGEPEEAERLFASAAALAPDDALVQAFFAQYWLSRGEAARADSLSARALSLNPECPEALVVRGRLSSMRGEMREAREAIEKAVRLAPTNAEAQYRLGIWFFGAKLHAEAAARFAKVVALRPRDAVAHDYLALSREALGEAERAEASYRSALGVNDVPFFDSFVDYNYGRFLLKQRRLEESRSHLDRAVALLPEHRGVHYERAKLWMAFADYPAAREEAERALALRDSGNFVLDVQVYYLLATVYARLGEKELARKYAELSRTTPIPDRDDERR